MRAAQRLLLAGSRTLLANAADTAACVPEALQPAAMRLSLALGAPVALQLHTSSGAAAASWEDSAAAPSQGADPQPPPPLPARRGRPRKDAAAAAAGPAAAAEPAAGRAAAAEPAAAEPRKPKTPYRVLARHVEMHDNTVDFADRMFAFDLDAEDEEAVAAAAAEAEAGPEQQEQEQQKQQQQQEQEQQQGEEPAAAAAPAPQPALAGDGAAAGGAVGPGGLDAAGVLSAFEQTDEKRQRRSKRLMAQLGDQKMVYDGWRERHAADIERATTACTAQGLSAELADALIQYIFKSRKTSRLWACEDDPSTTHVERGLAEARALVCGDLGLPPSKLEVLLARHPSLLLFRPTPEVMAVLQGIFGTRAALADVVLRHPHILSYSPMWLQRRLELVSLYMRCSEGEARAAVAQCPHLLEAKEFTIAANARFLGSLLPVRPYTTVVKRFPELLAGRQSDRSPSIALQKRLEMLQRHAPPELAAVDLLLLASQQPTLLLLRAREVAGAWRQLRAACEGVPAWQEELAQLAQPTLTIQQVEQQRAALEAAARDEALRAGEEVAALAPPADANALLADLLGGRSASGGGGGEHASDAEQAEEDEEAEEEGDSWLADLYREAGVGGTVATSSAGAGAPPAAPAAAAGEAGGQGAAAEPAWLTRDPESLAAAATPGAFGTQRRPWQEGDRVRVRQLARLLSARRWQLARLEYLAEVEPEAAGQRPLLEEVMASRAAFQAAHPGFPAWLSEQQARWRQARDGGAAEQAAAEGASAAAAAAAAGEGEAEAAAEFAEHPAAPEAAAAAAAHEQAALPTSAAAAQ